MKILINIIISLSAFFIAYGIAYFTGSSIVIFAILLAFIIHWVAFVPAYVFQTEKFYDLTGSMTYLSVVWITYSMSKNQYEMSIGSLILAILISIWAIRLGSFLFLRIHKDGEDKRFRKIKPSFSQFFMTWTLSGLWVSLCSMCALTAISNPSGIVLNIPTFIGLCLFIVGFTIEVIADYQKTVFRSDPGNKNKFIKSGLWSRSRHPNYFGEIILWFAIALISFSSLNGTQYLTLISPIFTYLLLVYVSGVRMLEARGDVKWGDNEEYIKYKKETPMLFFKI